MANRLKMALIDAILSLKARRWSNRRIATELGVDRDTVARQLRRAEQSNAAKVRIGAEGALPESNAAKGISFYPPAGRWRIKRLELNRADRGYGVWIGQERVSGVMGKR
jgi:DNA-binding Lrp family transcriptional regulator